MSISLGSYIVTIITRVSRDDIDILDVRLRCCRRINHRVAANRSFGVLWESGTWFSRICVFGHGLSYGQSLFTDSFTAVSHRLFYSFVLGAEMLTNKYKLSFRHELVIT